MTLDERQAGRTDRLRSQDRPLLTSMAQVAALIGRQSDARFYPYTVSSPFAYAEITQDGGKTWTMAQIIGDQPSSPGLPSVAFHWIEKPINRQEIQFFSVRFPQRTTTRRGITRLARIDDQWFANKRHAVRAVDPQAAKGLVFVGGVKDLTLLNATELQAEFANIKGEEGKEEFDIFSYVADYLAIANVLVFRGDFAKAMEIFEHARSLGEGVIADEQAQKFTTFLAFRMFAYK